MAYMLFYLKIYDVFIKRGDKK